MPSLLKEKITADTVSAMKAKDELRVGVLRMVRSAIQKWELAGKEKREATDADVIDVLQKEVKQRQEAAALYKQGGRAELALKEEQEMVIVLSYLPEQLSEAEVKAFVQEAIASTGAQGKKDMGKVMGALMPKVKGRADGKMVNMIVGSLLQS